jgi:dTDP-4-dehydrorhamnose 3,5-epimerase
MKFEPTNIDGLFLVSATTHKDDRGSFSRTYCEDESAVAGAPFHVSQINTSRNPVSGTLRGLHYQAAPKPDPKMVRCISGEIWDVAVDLRLGSPSYLKWFGTRLSEQTMDAMLIPAECAHGFITLSAHAEVLYLMGAPYDPGHACGVRWDDPAFGIEWPHQPAVIGERDATYPDFSEQ